MERKVGIECRSFAYLLLLPYQRCNKTTQQTANRIDCGLDEQRHYNRKRNKKLPCNHRRGQRCEAAWSHVAEWVRGCGNWSQKVHTFLFKELWQWLNFHGDRLSHSELQCYVGCSRLGGTGCQGHMGEMLSCWALGQGKEMRLSPRQKCWWHPLFLYWALPLLACRHKHRHSCYIITLNNRGCSAQMITWNSAPPNL